MKRKLLLSLGAIAAFSPVIAVVACGKISEPTSSRLDEYRKLTSSEATRILEEKWAEQVLKAQGVDIVDWSSADKKTGVFKLDVANARLKSTVQFIIRNEVAADKNYLNKISTSLLADRVAQWGATDPVTVSYLTNEGLAQIYNNQVIDFAATSTAGKRGVVSDAALNILLNYSKSDFRLKVYRQLVTETYLSKTNKDLYTKAFPRNARNMSLVQQDIESDKWALVNEALSQKLFAQWNVTLDKNTSAGFAGVKSAALSNVRDALTSTDSTKGLLAAVVLNSATKIKEHEELIDNTTYGNLVGWKGWVNVTATGTRKLAFTREELRKMTNASTNVKDTQWEGVLQDDDLATANINLIQDKSDSVNLTYMKGLMPAYNATDAKFTFKGTEYESKIEDVARLFAYKNSGLYKTASEFFRTKAEGLTPVVLDVKQSDVKTILQDANFEFIKERTAE